jgi:prepilin-type N-terminal cleavage/methylation domain-containing protein
MELVERMLKNQSGFSLIELMVVVMILGVLAAASVGFPSKARC